MYKKIISLGMSFLMLFEICTVNTFAKGGDGDFKSVEDRNTEKERHNFYCESSPKNECGRPEDVECVIEDALADFVTKAKATLPLNGIGEKCETDVYLWKYNGLTGLVSSFEKWLRNAKKRSVKGQFVANFIQETDKLFSLKSKEDAVEIINRWVKDSNYSKPFIDSIRDDLKDWVKKCKAYENDVSADVGEMLLGGSIGAAMGGAGGAGIGGLGGVIAGAGAAAGGGAAAGIGTAAVAAEAAPLLAGGGAAAGAGVVAGAGAVALVPLVAFAALTGAIIVGAGGVYYGYRSSKERKLNKKALEALKKSAKQKRKWDVYSWALENIFRAINNNEWVDNDLLLAELNYGKDSPYAMTNFINVGAEVPKNVTAIFKNLFSELSELINNTAKYHNKEEL